MTQLAALLLAVLLFVVIVDSRYRLLPHSIHSATFLHHPGLIITDITLTTCSTLNPFSSCQLDTNVWHRVEKELYLGSRWVDSAYLHVQRKKEEELTPSDKIVIDVRVGRLDPGLGEKDQQAERWEPRPGGIWLLRTGKHHESDSDKAVTAVDILFGVDAVEPRPGWTFTQTPLLLNAAADIHIARLSIRHGQVKTDRKDTQPRVRKDGKFKILQVSDLHLSTGLGSCRDALDDKGEVKTKCEADPRTLDFVERILDDEKPDMVVLSGDQVNGDTAPDVQSVFLPVLLPCLPLGPLIFTRPYSNSPICSLPVPSHMLPYSGTTTTKARAKRTSRGKHRCLSCRHCLFPCHSLVLPKSTVLETMLLRFWHRHRHITQPLPFTFSTLTAIVPTRIHIEAMIGSSKIRLSGFRKPLVA